MLAFDSRCIHSGEPMKSHTRISMDIRILPLSQYEKMNIEYQGSGRRKILLRRAIVITNFILITS